MANNAADGGTGKVKAGATGFLCDQGVRIDVRGFKRTQVFA